MEPYQDKPPDKSQARSIKTDTDSIQPWPTWFPVGDLEAERATFVAGTNGYAIFMALCQQRFRTPRAHRDLFYASEENIAHRCGLSTRSLREPLRRLVAAKLVGVVKPTGIARLKHEACRYYLIPMHRPEDSSGPERQRATTEISDIRDVLTPEGVKETSSAADAAPGPVGAGAASGERNKEENQTERPWL